MFVAGRFDFVFCISAPAGSTAGGTCTRVQTRGPGTPPCAGEKLEALPLREGVRTSGVDGGFCCSTPAAVPLRPVECGGIPGRPVPDRASCATLCLAAADDGFWLRVDQAAGHLPRPTNRPRPFRPPRTRRPTRIFTSTIRRYPDLLVHGAAENKKKALLGEPARLPANGFVIRLDGTGGRSLVGMDRFGEERRRRDDAQPAWEKKCKAKESSACCCFGQRTGAAADEGVRRDVGRHWLERSYYVREEPPARTFSDR